MGYAAAMADAVLEHTSRFTLEPVRSTALVVIDMQYATASRSAGLGRWLAERGRAEEGRYRFDRIEQLLVPNIARLLAFFREHDLNRVFLRLGSQVSGCRDLMPQLQELETALGNLAGNREFEILDEVAPRPGEPVLTKLSSSGFTSSGLDALLRNLGVTSLVLTGVSTSQCVDLTARDAADRGYRTLVVEDAVAEDRDDYHAWTLEQFRRLFGRVSSTDDVLAELRAALPARTG
jgi:nicotinamidase-related amidase